MDTGARRRNGQQDIGFCQGCGRPNNQCNGGCGGERPNHNQHGGNGNCGGCGKSHDNCECGSGCAFKTIGIIIIVLIAIIPGLVMFSYGVNTANEILAITARKVPGKEIMDTAYARVMEYTRANSMFLLAEIALMAVNIGLFCCYRSFMRGGHNVKRYYWYSSFAVTFLALILFLLAHGCFTIVLGRNASIVAGIIGIFATVFCYIAAAAFGIDWKMVVLIVTGTVLFFSSLYLIIIAPNKVYLTGLQAFGI